MGDDDVTRATRHFNLRLSEQEMSRVENLQEKLQERIAGRAGVSVRVSQKTVFLEALAALERELAEKERKR